MNRDALRTWMLSSEFNPSTSGLSQIMVPLIHHGLRRNRYSVPSQIALQQHWAGLAIEAAWQEHADECGLAQTWTTVLETAVRAVQTLTIQLSRPLIQRIVDNYVQENGYFDAAETLCRRRGISFNEVSPPPGSQQFFLGAAFYYDPTLNAFQAAGAQVFGPNLGLRCRVCR